MANTVPNLGNKAVDWVVTTCFPQPYRPPSNRHFAETFWWVHWSGSRNIRWWLLGRSLFRLTHSVDILPRLLDYLAVEVGRIWDWESEDYSLPLLSVIKKLVAYWVQFQNISWLRDFSIQNSKVSLSKLQQVTKPVVVTWAERYPLAICKQEGIVCGIRSNCVYVLIRILVKCGNSMTIGWQLCDAGRGNRQKSSLAF